MGIFDRFKSKKKDDRAKAPEKSKSKTENVLDLARDEKPAKEKKPVVLKEHTGDAFKVLLRAQLSEKSTMLAQRGKYVFLVVGGANKNEVKKAVQKVYDVHVTDVNIVNLHGKPRRYGKAVGRTRETKKAIVTLKAGERIEGIIETA